MKRSTLRIMRVKGEESQLRDTENIFNKSKKNHNLKKDMCMKVQEAYIIPNWLGQK